jgi:predicted alpha-1,2-mannosidase
MNKFVKFTILAGFLILVSCSPENATNELTYVDPDIGGVGLLLQPTRPTVQVPNQMIRVYPVRRDYLDNQIRYFPLTLVSHRNGELFGIMPLSGEITPDPPVSEWDNQLETITPYHLSTWLETYDITVEFVPGMKTGYFLFTYPDNSIKSLFLTNIRNGKWQMFDATTLIAEDSVAGMKAYVYAKLNQPAYLSDTSFTGRRRLYVSFDKRTERVIGFKYAISFISTEQAKENLDNEIPQWSFVELQEKAKKAWTETLGRIKVEGGTEAQRRTFYTAFYRCYERMVSVTEGDRYYSNYDGRIHEADRDFYVDDWIWDTYLAHHPLRSILDPALEADMIQSYIKMYEQSGWMPTFPILWGDNPCMNGFHSSIMILDAYRKGILDFNVDKAYEGMKKNALEATMLPWRNGPACSLDTFYYENGWYPALRPDETETITRVHPFEKRQAVAITLGHSYDDWAVAQMAKELGKMDDYEVFMKRSENYKNLWWPEKGFFMPKDAKGDWIEIDPAFDGGMGGRDYYDENNGWTYLWQVQHDLQGLISLMGGKENFEKRLDRLFTEPLGRSKYETWAKFPDFSGIVGQFSMGNEPSFHIPYLYNLTDSPWKTQKRIRMLLDAWFPDNIFGIPGDEDGGGMSAFVVFSAMGFYPLTPGLPVYTIGTPLFEKVTINLPDGKTFSVEAPGGTSVNKYIQKAWLNDIPLETPWFTHEELMNGGTLRFEMGPYPNKEWGKGKSQ